MKEYTKPEISEFAKQSSIQEGECYAHRDRKPYVLHPIKPIIVETIEFAKKMGFKRLGVAYCGGVTHETGILVDILEKHDFEVVSVSCKVGGAKRKNWHKG